MTTNAPGNAPIQALAVGKKTRVILNRYQLARAKYGPLVQRKVRNPNVERSLLMDVLGLQKVARKYIKQDINIVVVLMMEAVREVTSLVVV
jgi:hypothetical protein